MKIAAVVGSLRQDSYNRKVAEFIKDRYKDKLDIELVFLNDVVIFNEDIEGNPPKGVKEFKAKIKKSDGVIFVTPEYNHSIPGGLKNALDWCSRVERVLAKKPTFIVGASDGNTGTARAQGDLRKVLNGPGVAALNLPGNLFLLPNVQDKFDEDGNFIDDRSAKYLDKLINNYIEWIEKMK